jgi:23S rRNA pseudouridine1911/1915/1917 synthase
VKEIHVNRSEKAALIAQIKAKADAASFVVVTDFKGMTVEELTRLRAKLYECGGEYLVVKNTLARIALTDGMHDSVKDMFKENCGIALTSQDPVAVAKAVSEFAKTSKALSRLNEMFKTSEVKKTYWAIVKNAPKEPEGELVNYLVRNEKQNKSYAYDKEVPKSKKAILHYRLIGKSDNYFLLEVDLKTGRHHQIRCQLAKMGCPIKGDLKYGFARSNPDGSICLHARHISFVHPVSKEMIEVEAPVPPTNLWQGFQMI